MDNLLEQVTLTSLLDDFDYTSQSVGEHFHEVLGLMRARCPVLHSRAHGGYWIVTRYQDVARVMQDWETFTSTRGVTIPENEGFPKAIPEEIDPPLHNHYRHLINPHLSQSAVAGYEEGIRAIATELIDRFAETGTCDFMNDLARPFPARAFLELVLGAPSDGIPALQAAITDMTCYPGTQRAATGMMTAGQWVYQFMQDRLASPRRHDLADSVLHGTVEGRAMTDDEALRTLFLLIAGGIDTTGFVAGNIAVRMANEPSLQQQMRADPSGIGPAVEELLRLDGSFVAAGRVATRDTEIGGQLIKEGEHVLCYFASANRDAAEFPEPDVFNPTRRGRHLSFGAGPHRCAGIHFARLTLRVLFEEVATRMPDLRLSEPDQPIVWVQSLLHGPLTLPVRFSPAGLSNDPTHGIVCE